MGVGKWLGESEPDASAAFNKIPLNFSSDISMDNSSTITSSLSNDSSFYTVSVGVCGEHFAYRRSKVLIAWYASVMIVRFVEIG